MKTQNVKRLLRALWIKACRYDKIPENSSFVVFGENNPYIIRYNKIMSLYLVGLRS